MAVDSVGKHLLTAALCVSMNVFIQVIEKSQYKLPKIEINYQLITRFPVHFVQKGEKPYACPVCPRAFNQRVVLREHIRSHHSQPDPNYEDSLMPFYCTVCGNLFKTSQEIIQHLIEHSDANTVSNRQPVVSFIKLSVSKTFEFE